MNASSLRFFMRRLFNWFIYWLADFATPSSSLHTHRSSVKHWTKKNKWLRKLGIQIEADVAIERGFFILPFCESNVRVRESSVIGHNLRIYAFHTVEIGKYCMFAADVTLANGGHDKNTLEPFSGPLVIGNGCWIGNGARIIGPLSVGDNAIVAAGAVVVDDVPPSAIVAGVPAKVIGYRDLPDKVWHLGHTWFSPHTFETVE